LGGPYQESPLRIMSSPLDSFLIISSQFLIGSLRMNWWWGWWWLLKERLHHHVSRYLILVYRKEFNLPLWTSTFVLFNYPTPNWCQVKPVFHSVPSNKPPTPFVSRIYGTLLGSNTGIFWSHIITHHHQTWQKGRREMRFGEGKDAFLTQKIESSKCKWNGGGEWKLMEMINWRMIWNCSFSGVHPRILNWSIEFWFSRFN